MVPDLKWEAFIKDWHSLLESAIEGKYNLNLIHLHTYPEVVVMYIKDAWLKWKEKLVRF